MFGNAILIDFEYFLGCPRSCSTSTRDAKDANVWSLYIKGTCTRDNYFIGGTYIKDIGTKDVGIRNTNIGGAGVGYAFKCLGIHLQSSWILELRQYSLVLKCKRG